MTTALLVPGSASTGDFVRRAFRGLLAGVAEAVTVGEGTGDPVALADEIGREVDSREGTDRAVTVVVGVSVGAHAVAGWAASRAGQSAAGDLLLVCAMPAWIGEPDATAALTASAADLIAAAGISSEVARLQSEYPDDWVVAELTRAWTALGPTAVLASLRATAASAAPRHTDLHRIRQRAAVVALSDDPFHPAEVARQWVDAIPNAVLVHVGRMEPRGNLDIFGERVAQALAPDRSSINR